MRPGALRYWLIALLAVAGVLSVVANKSGSRIVGWLSVVAFIVALSLYAAWRRAVITERRARIRSREAGDETRARPDQ
jgi:uncharacterized protein (DUF58 family)